jgi:hypothetical protein
MADDSNTTKLDNFERTAIDVLQGIQGALADHSKLLNEKSARHRDEYLESQRKQDALLASLQATAKRAEQLVQAHESLNKEIRDGWSKHVVHAASEAGIAQARELGSQVVTSIEQRSHAVVASAARAITDIDNAAAEVRKMSRQVGWKTAAVVGGWVFGIGLSLAAFVWWKALREIEERVGLYSRVAIAAAAVKQDVSRAQLAECVVAGGPRLCIRVREDTPLQPGPGGVGTYAVLHSY